MSSPRLWKTSDMSSRHKRDDESPARRSRRSNRLTMNSPDDVKRDSDHKSDTRCVCTDNGSTRNMRRSSPSDTIMKDPDIGVCRGKRYMHREGSEDPGDGTCKSGSHDQCQAEKEIKNLIQNEIGHHYKLPTVGRRGDPQLRRFPTISHLDDDDIEAEGLPPTLLYVDDDDFVSGDATSTSSAVATAAARLGTGSPVGINAGGCIGNGIGCGYVGDFLDGDNIGSSVDGVRGCSIGDGRGFVADSELNMKGEIDISAQGGSRHESISHMFDSIVRSMMEDGVCSPADISSSADIADIDVSFTCSNNSHCIGIDGDDEVRESYDDDNNVYGYDDNDSAMNQGNGVASNKKSKDRGHGFPNSPGNVELMTSCATHGNSQICRSGCRSCLEENVAELLLSPIGGNFQSFPPYTILLEEDSSQCSDAEDEKLKHKSKHQRNNVDFPCQRRSRSPTKMPKTKIGFSRTLSGSLDRVSSAVRSAVGRIRSRSASPRRLLDSGVKFLQGSKEAILSNIDCLSASSASFSGANPKYRHVESFEMKEMSRESSQSKDVETTTYVAVEDVRNDGGMIASAEQNTEDVCCSTDDTVKQTTSTAITAADMDVEVRVEKKTSDNSTDVDSQMSVTTLVGFFETIDQKGLSEHPYTSQQSLNNQLSRGSSNSSAHQVDLQIDASTPNQESLNQFTKEDGVKEAALKQNQHTECVLDPLLKRKLVTDLINKCHTNVFQPADEPMDEQQIGPIHSCLQTSSIAASESNHVQLNTESTVTPIGHPESNVEKLIDPEVIVQALMKNQGESPPRPLQSCPSAASDVSGPIAAPPPNSPNANLCMQAKNVGTTVSLFETRSALCFGDNSLEIASDEDILLNGEKIPSTQSLRKEDKCNDLCSPSACNGQIANTAYDKVDAENTIGEVALYFEKKVSNSSPLISDVEEVGYDINDSIEQKLKNLPEPPIGDPVSSDESVDEIPLKRCTVQKFKLGPSSSKNGYGAPGFSKSAPQPSTSSSSKDTRYGHIAENKISEGFALHKVKEDICLASRKLTDAKVHENMETSEISIKMDVSQEIDTTKSSTNDTQRDAKSYVEPQLPEECEQSGLKDNSSDQISGENARSEKIVNNNPSVNVVQEACDPFENRAFGIIPENDRETAPPRSMTPISEIGLECEGDIASKEKDTQKVTPVQACLERPASPMLERGQNNKRSPRCIRWEIEEVIKEATCDATEDAGEETKDNVSWVGSEDKGEEAKNTQCAASKDVEEDEKDIKCFITEDVTKGMTCVTPEETGKLISEASCVVTEQGNGGSSFYNDQSNSCIPPLERFASLSIANIINERYPKLTKGETFVVNQSVCIEKYPSVGRDDVKNQCPIPFDFSKIDSYAINSDGQMDEGAIGGAEFDNGCFSKPQSPGATFPIVSDADMSMEGYAQCRRKTPILKRSAPMCVDTVARILHKNRKRSLDDRITKDSQSNSEPVRAFDYEALNDIALAAGFEGLNEIKAKESGIGVNENDEDDKNNGCNATRPSLTDISYQQYNNNQSYVPEKCNPIVQNDPAISGIHNSSKKQNSPLFIPSSISTLSNIQSAVNYTDRNYLRLCSSLTSIDDKSLGRHSRSTPISESDSASDISHYSDINFYMTVPTSRLYPQFKSATLNNRWGIMRQRSFFGNEFGLGSRGRHDDIFRSDNRLNEIRNGGHESSAIGERMVETRNKICQTLSFIERAQRRISECDMLIDRSLNTLQRSSEVSNLCRFQLESVNRLMKTGKCRRSKN